MLSIAQGLSAVFQPSAPSFPLCWNEKVPLHGVTVDDALSLVRWMASIGSHVVGLQNLAGLVGPKVSDQRATSWRAGREFHGSVSEDHGCNDMQSQYRRVGLSELMVNSKSLGAGAS